MNVNHVKCELVTFMALVHSSSLLSRTVSLNEHFNQHTCRIRENYYTSYCLLVRGGGDWSRTKSTSSEAICWYIVPYLDDSW
jgi:hypothetical protein